MEVEKVEPLDLTPAMIVAPPPKPEPPKPNVMRFLLEVPVGHPLPLGEVVTEEFTITVVAGARWHPEWDAPRIGVNVFRILSHYGDALCWSGESALALPLPEPVEYLANRHGDLIDTALAEQLALIGLTVPTKPEPYTAFHATRATERYTIN